MDENVGGPRNRISFDSSRLNSMMHGMDNVADSYNDTIGLLNEMNE